MRRKIEVSAKKVEDAISEGLKTLRTTIDLVDIKVISSGGFLKKAKVEIYYGEELPDEPVKTQAKVETKAEAKAQAKADAKAEAKPQAKVEAKTEVRPQAKVEAKTEVKAKTKVEAKQEAQPHAQKEFTEENRNRKHREREAEDPTAEQVHAAVDFLTPLIAKMKIDGNIEATVDDGLRINIATEDSRIIGYHGEVLDALQYLVSLKVNTDSNKFVHVSVDGLNYRNKRKDILESMAKRMADKAVRNGRKIVLEPMNSADRRVVHAALGENTDVFTRSEGHEPSRRIVILPKKKSNEKSI